jgi:hypothetical protein
LEDIFGKLVEKVIIWKRGFLEIIRGTLTILSFFHGFNFFPHGALIQGQTYKKVVWLYGISSLFLSISDYRDICPTTI